MSTVQLHGVKPGLHGATSSATKCICDLTDFACAKLARYLLHHGASERRSRYRLLTGYACVGLATSVVQLNCTDSSVLLDCLSENAKACDKLVIPDAYLTRYRPASGMNCGHLDYECAHATRCTLFIIRHETLCHFTVA